MKSAVLSNQMFPIFETFHLRVFENIHFLDLSFFFENMHMHFLEEQQNFFLQNNRILEKLKNLIILVCGLW